MQEKQKLLKQTSISRKSRTLCALLILTIGLSLSACVTAPTHEQATQALTYPEGRKWSAPEQTTAAKEIEDAGCDPDKPSPDGCNIPALLALLRDALSVLDQLGVARDALKE